MDNGVASFDFGHSYCMALKRLSDQRKTLSNLFSCASGAYANMMTYADTLTPGKDMGAERGTCDIYAGAVALVLDDVMKILICCYKKAGGKEEIGPYYGKGRFSLARVLKATGNNFRHYEEWRVDGNAPTKEQANNIRVIADVLHCPLPQPKTCSNHPFGNIVAWWVLKEIGGGGYSPLEAALRKTAREMVDVLGVESSPHVVWADKNIPAPYSA
jgi:hypothetical protein